jgi:NADPH-dependent curcumin reductase CurA
MTGGGVGEVVVSNHPDFQPGDIVENFTFGWQDHAVLGAQGTRKVDPALGPIQSALGYLGMPGLTAYFTILEVGRARPGDTVVISAASGAVGQIAGQLAKLAGGRAVGVASSDAKLAWCRELGYDAGINHRSANDLAAALADACPDGIDLYLDNTAGPIHDAVMQNLAPRARIVICGQVALADRFDQPDIGPRYLRQIMIARATVQGFLVFDHAGRFDLARKRLAAWARSGQLRHREDILDGIEQMPRAFLRLLEGRNFGKQLVRVADAR